MKQLPLFETDNQNQKDIVNVAKVPFRSPFRYPGGKTWFVPRIKKWISNLDYKPSYFIEPFVGGGIVSLTVAFEKLANRIVMVEIDHEIAAVWKTILSDDAEWLADEIINFDVTLDNVQNLLSSSTSETKNLAFKTVVKNRVNRGGIIAPGAGMIKSGENGKGLKSRWYPGTLKKRILNIAKIKDRITFIEGDAFQLMEEYSKIDDAIFFIDPPYTAGKKKAGRRLYKHSELNHEKLFEITSSLQGNFLMTYSNDEKVKTLAKKHSFDFEEIAMKSSHHAIMTELLIGKDLNWAR